MRLPKSNTMLPHYPTAPAKTRGGCHGFSLSFSLGFSITELMITLVIVTLLAAICTPAYREVVLIGRRAQGRSALYQLLLEQERYYTQHHHYAAFTAGRDAPFKWWSGDTASTSYYELHATTCAEQSLEHCVLLIATPGTERVGGGDDKQCGNLTLDSLGHKSQSPDPTPNPLCW